MKKKIFNSFKKAQINNIIYSEKILVENTIERIKIFHLAKTEWRHDLELHPIAMKALINILNVDLQFHPLRK